MNNRRVPDIILERFLLDELDEKRVRELRDMIAADTVLRLRLEEMKESSRDILSLYWRKPCPCAYAKRRAGKHGGS